MRVSDAIDTFRVRLQRNGLSPGGDADESWR
jgi:hypothetical protein